VPLTLPVRQMTTVYPVRLFEVDQRNNAST